MIVASNAPSTRRRWPRPQFSLRLLLVAFTAFAIGFPIWYRWPYRETREQRDPATGKLWSTRIITWQRQWGGDRLLHGPEQMISGDITTTTNNVRGKRHGPVSIHKKGRQTVTGQYVNDLKEGLWIDDSSITRWHWGLLDGDAEFSASDGTNNVATFAAGRMLSYNGKPLDDATAEVLQKRQMDHRVAAELGKETNVDFVEVPLKDGMMYIGDLHNIPIALDPRGSFAADLPITVTLRGLDLQSALVLITAPHELACDYRYGSLWIATADKVKDWHDPTGVADIKPPRGSALARAWNEPLAVDVVQSPLAKVMKFLEDTMAVSIDASRAQAMPDGKPILVTAMIRDQPLRNVLGRILYNTGCRCELDGETLVILPPEE